MANAVLREVRKPSVDSNAVDALDFHLYLPFSILFYIFSEGWSLFIRKEFTAIVNNGGLLLLKDT